MVYARVSTGLKVRRFSVFLFLVAGTPGVAAGQDKGPPIDHARAAELFLEALELDPASPWPGPLYGPILFVDPASRYVVANEADPEGVLQAVDGVFVGSLPAGTGIANTAMRWSGQTWTMVMWPLPAGYYARRRLVAHELFHRLGPELGVPMASPANAHLETRDGRLLLRLEMRALARALASRGTAREEALLDALGFRARRHEAFPAGSEAERRFELNEGLAEYTGVRVSLPQGARDGWAVHRIEAAEAAAVRGGLTSNFAYSTGLAYGLLLDARHPEWVQSVTASTDLAALAGEVYGVAASPAEARGRASDAEGRYGGARLSAFESEREASHVHAQQEFRARYIEGPTLSLPVDNEFGYTYDPNRVAAFDGVGQVFATAEVRGGWGTLTVTDGVLLRRDDRGITGVVVAAPAGDGPPWTGMGWILALNEGWEVARGERAGDWTVRRAR